MALTIMLAVWLVHMQGMFRCADDFAGDLLKARHSDFHAANNVLLVYTDRQTLYGDDERLARLIAAIERYQPSQMGITQRLSSAQQSRVLDVISPGRVIFGTTLAELVNPARNIDPKARYGYLDLGLHDQPTYRWHLASVVGRDRMFQSLEAQLARRHRPSANIPRGRYGIRYQGAANGLPHVDQSAFLDGSVISELVRGRVVLVGLAEEGELGVATPTTLGSARMSRLELHGQILETILQGSGVRCARPPESLLVLLLLTMVSNLVFRQSPTSLILRSGIGWLIFSTVVFWLALKLLSIQLPLSAMWLTCLLIFVGVLKSRFQILTHFFEQWKLLRRTNIKSTWTASYDEIWSSVAQSTMHIFHPMRLVILELETGSTHLRVRETIGCQEDAIVEKRRDVSRHPYRDAMEMRSPQAIDDRPFLSTDPSGTQYIVPLISHSGTQGAMVLEMDQSTSPEAGDFKDRLTEFADKMAAFLAGTRERELERLLSSMTLRRFRLLPEIIASRALYQDEDDHRRYEDLLARALDVSEVGVAIYDVFGNLLKSNKRMIDRLQQRDISVVDQNCVDVLAALTGHTVRSCRELVRQCLIGNRIEEIMLAPRDDESSASVLYVKPLRAPDASSDEDDGLENRCISIQYLDGTAFRDMYDWQTRFSKSQSEILEDQMLRLESLVETTTGEEQNAIDDGNEADGDLRLADEILDAVRQCQSVINFGLSERPEDFFACNANAILQSALDNCKDECETRGVTIKQNALQFPAGETSDQPGSRPDINVISNPILLRRVFAFAIDCLLDDASRQTQIVIDQKQADDRLHIRFDVVPRPTRGDVETSERRRWEVTDTDAAGGKAAMVLVRKHADRLIEVSRWLRQWGATMQYQCARSYQPSIEIELACSDTDRHPDPEVDESVKSPAPDSTTKENGDA